MIYGAILDADGRVNGKKTDAKRARIRAARVNGGGQRRIGETIYEASTGLTVKRGGNGRYWACAKCSADLGPLSATTRMRVSARTGKFRLAIP